MRTTLDIDDPILQSLKELKKREGRSLGQITSELLAYALDRRAREAGEQQPPINWTAKQMGAQVDLADRDAIYDLMDGHS